VLVDCAAPSGFWSESTPASLSFQNTDSTLVSDPGLGRIEEQMASFRTLDGLNDLPLLSIR
jgi:hypothetical protein